MKTLILILFAAPSLCFGEDSKVAVASYTFLPDLLKPVLNKA